MNLFLTLAWRLVLLLFIGSTGAIAATMALEPVPSFPDDSLQSWEEESFSGNTLYELVNENGSTVLKATANKSASVLIKRQSIDLTNTPWLDWSWKIDSVYEGINELTKAGDDFPARLYVTARTGFLPWEVIAINYVWSSDQTVGTSWMSPFTKKSVMVAVQSGSDHSGEWIAQRRNVAEDFKTLFNTDITELVGYAVMVDGDNSSQVGAAYFGDIRFSANPN